EVQTTVVDADQRVLTVLTTVVHAEAKASAPFSVQTSVTKPHLWQVRDDPFLYMAYTVVSTGSQARALVVQPLGLQTFRVDAEQGFFLNEKNLDLHGVNRHQDLLGRGWAMSSDDEQRDFSLIAEIGATAVRLAHYQQPIRLRFDRQARIRGL